VNEALEILNLPAVGLPFALLLGLICGSFFNVCILRIPAEKSLLTRSQCPKCKTLIPWYCNVPVLSFIWLQGACRNCKERISLQYPAVEIATGLLFAGLFFYYGIGIQFAAYAVFLSFLLMVSVIDYHHQIIPDEFSLGGTVLGFGACFLTGDVSWESSVVGILLGGGVFMAIAYLYERVTQREGLGGGDVKLLGMIGAWLGVQSILPVIIISSAVGSIIGIALMMFQRRGFKTAIPFGPFLALAATIYLFASESILNFLYPTPN